MTVDRCPASVSLTLYPFATCRAMRWIEATTPPDRGFQVDHGGRERNPPASASTTVPATLADTKIDFRRFRGAAAALLAAVAASLRPAAAPAAAARR